MDAELVVLGAGSMMPRADYGCSGYALCPSDEGEVTLLDCGPGSIRALGAAGIALERVRRVVLSHYHLDHCLDLFALLFARRNPDLQALPELEFIGPRGLRRVLDGGRQAFGRWIEEERLTVREVGAEIPTDGDGCAGISCGDLEFSCAPTGHSPEAIAWRVNLPGASLAYTGDTPFEPRVAELAQGVDLFVVECSFPDETPRANHLTPRLAGDLAALARCHKLLLTHFYPDMEPELAICRAGERFSGLIEAARDGARHAIKAERQA